MNTPFLDAAFKRVEFERELVFRFFVVFSLFECALKRAGFCSTGPGGGAQPDWADFAESIHLRFSALSEPQLSAAVDYMVNFPVQQQVSQNNKLAFRPILRRHNMSDTVWLSVLIRGVRNNLFHGGKWEFDPTRDPELLKHSLTILEVWGQLDPGVAQELSDVQ